MTSNLDCIGLGVEDQAALRALITEVLPKSVSLGVAGGVDVRRWEDPSGSRIVLGVRQKEIVDLLPSFAAPTDARLGDVHPVTEEIVVGDVLDENGEMLTRLAMGLEERRFFPSNAEIGCSASVVALGVDVTVHQDEEAFGKSPESFLDGAHEGEEPPATYAERGLKWPPRMGAESFISQGLFGEPNAHARLYGTVLVSERRTVSDTGKSVVVVAVRTVGFTARICIPGDSLATDPAAGNVVGGTVYLVGSIPELLEGRERQRSERKSWLRRRT